MSIHGRHALVRPKGRSWISKSALAYMRWSRLAGAWCKCKYGGSSGSPAGGPEPDEWSRTLFVQLQLVLRYRSPDHTSAAAGETGTRLSRTRLRRAAPPAAKAERQDARSGRRRLSDTDLEGACSACSACVRMQGSIRRARLCIVDTPSRSSALIPTINNGQGRHFRSPAATTTLGQRRSRRSSGPRSACGPREMCATCPKWRSGRSARVAAGAMVVTY